MQHRKTWFLKGIRDGVPIFLGYLAVSFTLGIAARNAGLTAFQATLMSLTNNTSAGEFAALGIISSGATYMEMAITQLIVNLRYFLMSCALSQKLDSKVPFFHRLLVGYDVTDEVFGVSVSVDGKLNPYYTYGLMFISIPGWAMGTFFGVTIGNILPDRIVSAMSIALYGMFIAIIVPPSKKNKVLACVVIGSMLTSILFTMIPIIKEISAGFRIIILTVFISGIAAVLFPVKDEALQEEIHES